MPSFSFIKAKEITSVVSQKDINSIFVKGRKKYGNTDITYDASFDNGSTWTTGLALDYTIDEDLITSTLGNQLILKFNIPSETEAKLYGYSYEIGRVN